MVQQLFVSTKIDLAVCTLKNSENIPSSTIVEISVSKQGFHAHIVSGRTPWKQNMHGKHSEGGVQLWISLPLGLHTECKARRRGYMLGSCEYGNFQLMRSSVRMTYMYPFWKDHGHSFQSKKNLAIWGPGVYILKYRWPEHS